MQKVLYITDFVDIGGGESSLLNIMIYYKRNKILEPILLAPKDGELIKIARDNNIKVYTHELSPLSRAWIKFIPLFWIPTIIYIVNLIKEESIDIVHMNSNGKSLVNGSIAARISKIKAVWTCHGWWEKPFGLRAKVLNPLLNRIFTVSEYVNKYVTFPESKVKCTYLGIEIGDITGGKRDSIRKELGYHQQDIVIGVIGRYQKVKRQDIFIKVAERLKEKGYDRCKFILVGDVAFDKVNEEYKKYVISLINKSKFKDSIKMIGFKRDLRDIYAGLDILVVPSEFESFSMVTLEGMANGLIVVATDKGGPSEIIQNEVNGFLFKSLDEDDLMLNLEKAINTEKSIGKLAYQRSGNFSIENIANKIKREYDKM